jgi:hypothetical protein
MARDTFRYVLRNGRKIVQFGISNGPEDRISEHIRAGKRFTSMAIVGPRVTRESARDWERCRIDTYHLTHGRRPRYNKV